MSTFNQYNLDGFRKIMLTVKHGSHGSQPHGKNLSLEYLGGRGRKITSHSRPS